MILSKITYIFYSIIFITQCKSDCVTPVNSLKNILVVDRYNNIEYANDGQGNIVKKNGDFISLTCPGSSLNLRAGMNRMMLTCTNDAYKHNLAHITCTQPLASTEQRLGNCNGGNQHLQIGNQIIGYMGKFIPHIDLCWDDVKKRTLWTHAKLQTSLGECHDEPSRSDYRSGTYFPSTLSKYYTEQEQLNTLRTMYNQIPAQINTNNLLEVGHLVPKCDFAFDAQQRSTFQYINVAPQWKSFNSQGNWRTLEADIRNLIREESSELEVYTGTFGILQIQGRDFYLNSRNAQVPVPKYFWKVVIKKESAQTLGVAIVGSNDIFNSNADPCRDIMGSINWLNIPQAKSRSSGYLIACDVYDFVNIAGLKDQLPGFPTVTGVLAGTSAVPPGP